MATEYWIYYSDDGGATWHRYSQVPFDTGPASALEGAISALASTTTPGSIVSGGENQLGTNRTFVLNGTVDGVWDIRTSTGDNTGASVQVFSGNRILGIGTAGLVMWWNGSAWTTTSLNETTATTIFDDIFDGGTVLTLEKGEAGSSVTETGGELVMDAVVPLNLGNLWDSAFGAGDGMRASDDIATYDTSGTTVVRIDAETILDDWIGGISYWIDDTNAYLLESYAGAALFSGVRASRVVAGAYTTVDDSGAFDPMDTTVYLRLYHNRSATGIDVDGITLAADEVAFFYSLTGSAWTLVGRETNALGGNPLYFGVHSRSDEPILQTLPTCSFGRLTVAEMTSAATSETVTAVRGISSTNAWAVGTNGAIWSWDGSLWTPSQAPDAAQTDLNSVWPYDANWAIAVGDGSYVYTWNGTTWTATASPTANLNAVWGISPTDVWAGGPSGVLFHYDGSTWTQVTSPTSQAILEIRGTATDDLYARAGTGTSSQMLHWNGTAWSVVVAAGSGVASAWSGMFGMDSITATTGGGGAALELTWLAFYVGLKQGPVRLPGSRGM